MNTFLLGGAGGIGQEIQALFIEKGHTVVAPTSKELDLNCPNSIENYLRSRELSYTSFDSFIHVAGYNVVNDFENLADEDIHRSLQVNVLGFLSTVRPFLSAFANNKTGHVLVFSSLYSMLARCGRLPYVISKHALNGVVKTLALEYGPSNVLINGIAPGFVNTPMTRRNNDAEAFSRIVFNIPLGRMATPREIATLAHFLCSSENTYMTGQVVTIDGGYSVGGFQR